MPSLPTKSDLIVGAVSLNISYLLIIVAFGLWIINYDVYNVKTDQDLEEFHKIISSNSNRIETEIAVSLLWLSYPFLLLQSRVFTKLLDCLYLKDDPNDNSLCWLAYLYEKSILIWTVVTIIIIPAIMLITVSYDWGNDINHHYVQLYLVMFQLELIDCVCIADLFLTLLPLCTNIIIMYYHRKGNAKYAKLYNVVFPNGSKCFCIHCYYFEVITVFILCISFALILFEFGDSGIFSFTSKLKYILFFLFFWKMRWAGLMMRLSKKNEIRTIKQIIYQDSRTTHAIFTDNSGTVEIDMNTIKT
eukprot:312978_1